MSNGMPQNSNPYSAPQANVADIVEQVDANLLETPRSVSAGAGAGWIGQGWKLFMNSPGAWIGMLVVYIIIQIVLGLIPLIGQIAQSLLGAFFFGGIMIGCHEAYGGGKFRLNHLWSATSKLTPLILLSLCGILLAIAGILVLGVIAVAVVGTSTITALFNDKAAAEAMLMGMWPTLATIAVLGVVAFLPFSLATWIAPALVVFHDKGPLDALMFALRGCYKNFAAIVIYFIIAMVIVFIGAIPFGLGLLAIGPTLMAATYIAYREIFLQD